MNATRIATALALVTGVFITYTGIMFLIDPVTTASGFGLPAWPEGEAAGFLNVKGDRDIASGLVILGLVALRQRLALGVAMLAMTAAPLGDMLIVLSRGGSTALAFGMHGVAAAIVAASGILLLREHRKAATAQPLAV
ncbi:DUF4267 domain-containing protein [Nocardia neocaledoniensis]|uniref:DUF4267 domain-containing protein n=1 Tax=Nocardia neocaledoniensis TaxID=236511 RepID=UPI00245903B6|nr:DUF4267 domain-containing protein [Nocardia neocaledoniensis]